MRLLMRLKLDTNDFFVEPDIWELLDEVRQEAAKYDVNYYQKSMSIIPFK